MCSCGTLQSCSCGAINAFPDYQDRQHIIQFLMGLNECFSHVRGQILLIGHFLDITKVFSLVVQEVKQAEIGYVRNSMEDSMALMSKKMADSGKINFVKPQQRKDKFLCTHYTLWYE